MNRWLAGAVVLIAILIASVYWLIPSHLVVTNIVVVHCNRDAADRVLRDTADWKKWWPAEVRGDYNLSKRLNHGAVISMDDGGNGIPSTLNIYPLGPLDSCYLQWQFVREAGANPVKRVGQYRQAVKLKGDMTVILDSLRNYLSDPLKVYGVAITEASTNDSFLVQTERTVTGYPGTTEIYDLVKKLNSYAIRRGGFQTGHPMINVDPKPNDQFFLRIALPVDKECKDSGDVVFRKLVRGNYLESDVRGGPGAVGDAFRRMKDYITDYKRTVMAIPFFSLITDRMRETDSTKWVTRIYYPIY